MDGFEFLVMHHFCGGTAGTDGLDHAVLAASDALTQGEDVFDPGGWDKHGAAAVRYDIVVFMDQDTGDRDGLSR